MSLHYIHFVATRVFSFVLLSILAALSPAAAAEPPCNALSVVDIASLGFTQVKEGYTTGWSQNVTLGAQAAIYGREADCVWSTPHGNVTLTLGEMDVNVVKGDQQRTLARKVLAAFQERLKVEEQYHGARWTVTPLPGVGEEAITARFNALTFQVVGYQGSRMARLQVSATPGTPGKPTPEQAGALLAKVLAAGTTYSSAGGPPVERRWGGEEEGDRYGVTGAVVASGSLSGTFSWSSPNAVELYPDRVEIVLNSADRSAFMNLQVFRGDGRVVVRSGKLGAAKLEGSGGKAVVDVLKGAGVVSLDATVKATSGEQVTLRGALTIRPVER